jgi:hypothetical protein
MAAIDSTTLTVDELALMLRAWANGLYTCEAAVELLIGHGVWLHRKSFLSRCVDAVDDGWFNGEDVAMAFIDWEAARAGLDDDQLPGSSSELRMLRLAISLAGGDTDPTAAPLAELIPGLDHTNAALVLESIAHLAGWHEHHIARRITGELPLVDR